MSQLSTHMADYWRGARAMGRKRRAAALAMGLLLALAWYVLLEALLEDEDEGPRFTICRARAACGGAGMGDTKHTPFLWTHRHGSGTV